MKGFRVHVGIMARATLCGRPTFLLPSSFRNNWVYSFRFRTSCTDNNVSVTSNLPVETSQLAALPADIELQENQKEKKLESGLYLVATPIGNLEDITLRALRVLRSADLILAEDTRHSSKLLNYYDIQKPKMSYHKFNESSREDSIIERLQRGQVLALISDAGTPGISDPGSDLVRACVEANMNVVPVPGPSAAITALVASGLPTDEFTFVGFLPTHTAARQRRLVTCANATATQILFVPPHKLSSIVADCIIAFGGSRRCVVARELTKIHEEFWRGTLALAQTEFSKREPKGEICLVIQGLPANSVERFPTEEELEARLELLLNSGNSLSEAVKVVTEESFVRRNSVYSIALRVSKRRNFSD